MARGEPHSNATAWSASRRSSAAATASDGSVETAEVRVDGVHHEAASRVLARLGWPRPADGMSYARTFMLLVHRERS
ncbi:DUF6348 family protein [Microtetraspora malaysiensis]|uniref:DUF6348 family protein n=1 Tax=Microtetraspora malaysiensis TaxID=161358 RepID=UPI003D901676